MSTQIFIAVLLIAPKLETVCINWQIDEQDIYLQSGILLTIKVLY